jgi:hypothetical protein
LINSENELQADAPNSPNLDTSGKQHTPALLNIGQAVGLVRSLVAENRDRSLKNARIQEKYNSERPQDPNRLTADGLAWKTNFSTKPLATLIDKVVPRFTTALRQMRYLTASKLPDTEPGAADKTEAFRRTITEACRGHEGWEELMSEIAQENALFGYVGLGWLDSFSWFPTFYRQDMFLVPNGTKHTANTAQVVCLKNSYLLHEMFEWIANPEAAKSAGVTVGNVILSLNDATPEDRRSTSQDPERIYADLAREGSVITSFHGAKTVEVWHVLVAEVDGRITHVAFDAKSDLQLLWVPKQFESMSDAVTFFSFQHGNGKLQGSKGIGRELYNMATVLDRARNEAVDRLQLSGKLVLTCPENQIKRFRMSVVGNAILIAEGYTVQQQRIDGAIEPFVALDRFLTDLLDQVAGSTSPKAFEGERVTRAAVEVQTSREEERRDAIIERFLGQFSRMMSTIQRRLCNPETIDRTALEVQKKLLSIMTPEELDYLAKSPAVSTVRDYTEGERERVIMVSAEARGNPLYNQHELEKRALIAKVDVAFAEAVLLPVNDPTEQAENVRQQKLELIIIKTGDVIDVSPRDSHIVHLQVLKEAAGPYIQAAVDDPVNVHVLDAIAQHAAEHVKAAQTLGLGKQVAEFENWVNQLVQGIQKLNEHEAQVQQDIAAQGGPQAQVDEQGQPVAPQAPKPSNNDNVTLNYKDMPPSIQRQMEAAAGFQPATETPEELARIKLLSVPPEIPAPAPLPPPPEEPDLVGMMKVIPYLDSPPSIQRQIETRLGFVPATNEEALASARAMTKATALPKPKTPTPK